MREFLWRMIAQFVCRPAVTAWIIKRAMRTPYMKIARGDDVYLESWRFFNPYEKKTAGKLFMFGAWLPSIRVHLFHRPDAEEHQHNHPWEVRSIIMRGLVYK